jgi:hypothetical protein
MTSFCWFQSTCKTYPYDENISRIRAVITSFRICLWDNICAEMEINRNLCHLNLFPWRAKHDYGTKQRTAPIQIPFFAFFLDTFPCYTLSEYIDTHTHTIYWIGTVNSIFVAYCCLYEEGSMPEVIKRLGRWATLKICYKGRGVQIYKYLPQPTCN